MAYSSSLLLESQQLNMGDDDMEFAPPDEAANMEDDEQPVAEMKQSALTKHLNPALGAAAELLPHLRWLCACCGIATAASAEDDAAAGGVAAAAASATGVNTPGDANSAVTAIANLEQQALADHAGHSVAPLLALLLKGERTSSAASVPSSAFSLTPSSSPDSSQSSSSSGGATAVSVPGILAILRALVASNRLDPVRSALLGLMLQIAQKYAGALRPHLSALIQSCLFVVRAEKLGRIKEKGCELLGFLLMLVHTYKLDISAQPEYTPPRDIISQLFRELNVSKSKLSQTMRGNLLSTLGLLSELFEDEFRRQPDSVRELADFYGRSLAEELESGKPPTAKVIEGCLIGLKHFLMHFSESYRRNHQQKVLRLEGIYKAVRTAIGMQSEDVKKYDILRAGLACFSRHAPLFRDFITPAATTLAVKPDAGAAAAPTETEALLSLLLQASKHGNITVSSRANYALEAFLQQVAAWLVETPEINVKAQPHMPSYGAGAAAAAAAAPAGGITSTKRRLFNLLLSVFVKKLDASKSVSEVSLAVRAVGQLAKVVVMYLNETELRKILAKLLEQSEKLFRAQTLDEVDRAVSHMPDFLSAFAFILKELPEVDSSVLDYIVSMVRRFFLAYPTFTSSQRSKNMVSLTRLYVVLYTKGILFQNLLDKTLLSALVLTISKLPQLTDMQFFRQGKPLLSERQAYVEYSYLFHNLLGVSVRQDDKGDKSILGWNKGLEIEDGEAVVWQMRKALFDQMMSSAIKLLKTLDLSLVSIQAQQAGDEQASSAAAAAAAAAAPLGPAPTPSSSDPSSSFAPANPKDYELFHNLIEFLQRFFFPPYAGTGETAAQVGAASSATAAPEEKLILNHHVGKKSSLRELVMPSLVSGSLQSASSFLPKWALQWIAILVPELIALSNKNPLVSGYYKLLSLIGRIMEQFSYLSDIDLRPTRIKLEEEGYDGVRVKREGAASPVVKMEDEGDEKHDPASSAATDASSSSASAEVALISAKKVPLDTVANRRFVFNLMSDFLDSVLVRIGQFTDELLYAAIHLVLSAPLQFVRLEAWVPALIKAIDIGKNYRPAAYLSVQVLNKLHDAAGGSNSNNNDEAEAVAAQSNIRISSAELSHFLPEILPHLYDYLRVPKADSAAIAASMDSKKTTTATQRSNAAEQVELELVSRILQFLGRVGGQNRFLLGKQAAMEGDNSGAAGPANTSIVAPRWAPTAAIKFPLPLSMTLNVTLDELLPHLTHLAEFSTERKVQVAACEALHALIIFMIAMTARDPNRSNDGKSADESAFLAIYQNLFPIMLRLATSVEIVTKQLFSPLLQQIIHWFSNTNTTLPKDTRALLDAVVDAVGNEGNGALREYAAEAMSEFLKWAMKHGSPVNKGTGRATRGGEEEEKASSAAAAPAGGSAINTKALLRRLFTLALHPSPAKRLGAALTFNKLYKIFREYDALIAHHTLDILEHMLRSLRLAEHDDEALGTLDEARTAIAALERIVTDADARKFKLLLQPAKPERAGGAFCQTLPLFCTHLLETAGSLEDNVRRESLRLFQSFCKVLPKAANGQDVGQSFFRDYINDSQSLKQFVAIVERGEGVMDALNTGEAASSASAAAPADSRPSEIVAPPWTVDAVNSMSDLDEASSGISDAARWQSLQTWLTRLSSALDVYWWLLREKLVSASVSEASDRVFGDDGGSALKPSLKNFLILMSCSSGATNRVDAWVTTYADTASTTTAAATALKEKYASLKCTVLIRLFRFMQLQLSDEAGAGSAFRSLLGHAFYSLIFRAVLLPETMGFQSSHTKRIQLLQQTIGQLCSTLSKLSNKRHIIDALSTLLQEPQVAPASFQLSLMLNRVGFSAMVMEGYRQLWSSGLLPLALGADQCTEFAHTLLQNAFTLHTRISGSESDRKVQLSPLGRNMANQMLQLAFHIGVSPDRLFTCLTDQSTVELPSRGSRPAPAAAASTVIRVKLEQDLDVLTTNVDSAAVSTAALSSDSRKGGVFYSQFRSLIDSYLAYRFPIFAAHILSRAFTSKDMFGLMINVADYVIQRRQRKVAVQGAFSTNLTLTTSQGAAPAAGGFSSVIAEVQSQADSYVQQITDGFSDACSAFMATRSLASGSSNASVGGAGYNPKKQSARQRSAAPVNRDTSKLLQLPSDSELASMLLQLIERLLILDAPKVLSASSNPSFASMLEIYLQCLSVDANLALKKKAISILPALFLAPTSTQGASAVSTPSLLVAPPGMEPLIGSLRQMLMHPPFPPRSTDLMIGSAEWVDYTSLLDLLLNALVLSKSFVLLELLLPILREGDTHTYKSAIHLKLAEYLNALVSNSLGERAVQVDEVLSKTFELFSQQDLDTSAVNNVRYWLAKYILIPLLRLCGLSSARTFFQRNIKRIFSIVAALPDGPKFSASTEDQQLALMEMEVAYSLIAIMYRRLDKSEPAAKEIAHKDVIKYSHQHVKHLKVSPSVSSMAFAGAAFHALSCALMATQTDPKFLNVLCFTETAAKGEELWTHLIDVNRIGLLKFEIETNFATVDATLADMQLLSRAPNAVVPDAADDEAASIKGPRYLSSQYLSDSSVSQEAQGLFENQFQGPLHLLQQQQQSASSDAMVDEEEMSTSSVAMAVDSSVVEMVDLDPIMNIPAMPILLQLVEFMENKFGAAHRDGQAVGDSTKMPDWMMLVWQKFQSPSTHVTIKWCIAKLIVLKPAIFQPYASMWFISMVELMTMPPEQNGGIGFHYFLRDLCSVFLRWRFVPGPDEPDREAASTLIAHLMRVAIDHGQATEGKRSRLRANLLTIKLLIDLWQHRLRIDRRIIHMHLTRDITKARAGSDALTARQIGLQLFAIIIEKGFPGFDPIEDRLLKEDDILTALINTMSADLKTLYEPAAEVMGIWISRLAKEQRSGNDMMGGGDETAARMLKHAEHAVRQCLKKLFFARDFTIFFNILLKLSLYLGRQNFLNDDLLTLVFQVPQTSGEFLHKFLQLLCWSSTTTGRGIYERLKPTIKRVFLTVDSKAHELVLMLLFRLAGELTLDDLRELVPDLAVLFPKHSNEACRMLFYKILIWLWDQHDAFQDKKVAFLVASSQQGKPVGSPPPASNKRGAAAAASASSSSSVAADKNDPLVHLIVVSLLRGLSDSVASVREHMFEFFNHESRLSSDVHDRMLKLLTSFFHAETVELWLSYATRLLMYPMRKSSQWNTPFSPEALEKTAKFDVININASGFTRSQPMQPLFGTGSQASLSMDMSSGQPKDDDALQMADIDGAAAGGAGWVLNSQAGGANFAATPSLMSMTTQELMQYNLSQSSQSEHLFYRTGGTGSQQAMGSYAAFTSSPQQRAIQKRLKGKKRVSIKDSRYLKSGTDTVSLRFAGSVAGARANSLKWRTQADFKNRYEKVWAARVAEESASSVTLFRQYRKGDLPDIQLKNAELLQPLESLHTEPAVARQLFVTIFHAVYMQTHPNPEQTRRFRGEMREAVRSLLHRLTPSMAAQAAPLVFALQTAILRCGADDPKFTSGWDGHDIKQLGEISFHSKTYHSGVLLLEHVIATQTDVKMQTAKRHRDEETAERHEQAYFQLARLYRELRENEIMMNLYSQFAKQTYTRDAISAMLRGDWQAAMTSYDDALNRFDQVTSGAAEWVDPTPSNDEIELWSDERLECLRQLTSWSALRANVLEEIDHQPDRLWDPQYTLHGEYLRHYLTSGLKVTEEVFLSISNAAAVAASSSDAPAPAADAAASEDPRAELLRFVERAFKKQAESDILQKQHAADLVLLYALNGFVDNATNFLRRTYSRFLVEWTDLPQNATGPRLALLERLQKLSEVSEFLSLESQLSSMPTPTPAAAASLVKKADPTAAQVTALLSITANMQHQLSVWRTRLPSSSDSVESWDDIVLNRSAFLVHLKQSIEGKVASMPAAQQRHLKHVVDAVRADLSSATVEMYRRAANVMLKQGNTAVAGKYISASKQLLRAHGVLRTASISERDADLAAQLDFLLNYSSIKVKHAHLTSTPLSFGANMSDKAIDEGKRKYNAKLVKMLHTLLGSSWESSVALKQRPSLPLQPDNLYHASTQKAALGQELGDLLLHDPTLSKHADNKTFELLMEEAGDELDQMAITFHNIITDPALSGPAHAVERASVHRRAGKAFMATARFCDRRLTQCDDHKDTCQACKSHGPCIHPLRLKAELEAHLIESMVDNVLAAMKLGSMDAVSMFPRALEWMGSVEPKSPLRKRFRADTASIPSWMFIQWIPQLLAVIALPEAELAFPLLVRIAKEYPQAIYAPFNMTKESLMPSEPGSKQSGGVSSVTVGYLNRLSSFLRLRLLGDFIQALDYLMVPEMKLRDLMGKMNRAINAGETEAAQKMWTNFRHRHTSSARPAVAMQFGVVYENFKTSWYKVLDSYFGNDGRLIRKMNGTSVEPGNWRKVLDAITKKIGNEPGVMKDAGKKSLATYTLWLGQYEKYAAASGEHIELPGQYSGKVRPQPEAHIRIVNFDPTILVMSSLRKPKRLTILGSDERSHNYLVKGGEDLRMDQRVEQVFCTMNEILAADTATARRALSLRTYQVIPFSPTMGMLEWVPDTEPLKGLLLGTTELQVMMSKMSTKFNEFLATLYDKYNRGKPLPAQNHYALYFNMLKNADKATVAQQYRAIADMIAPDLVARFISRLCATPESFLSFRSSFARTFCSLTICAYILGLGDRHLENFLVCTRTGELVGIDFGAAFGQGVLLSVPELMPFRYTRQLQNMLAPLQTEAALSQDMTYVLRALRAAKSQLLTVMDVFVKEPQMEWIAAAGKEKRDAAFGDDVAGVAAGLAGVSVSPASSSSAAAAPASSASDWYARRKIRIATMKLDGANPSRVLALELKENKNVCSHKDLYDRCVLHLKGEPKSKRADADVCSTPAEQVALLLDMAKDPNILGRTWVGWGPFL